MLVFTFFPKIGFRVDGRTASRQSAIFSGLAACSPPAHFSGFGVGLVIFTLLFHTSVRTAIAQTNKISLDGNWQIIFDDNNVGRSAEWMKPEVFAKHPDRQSIKVPMAWETLKQDYEGVAFYKTTFDVPADWEGKTIRLQFGAVNYIAEVWVNDAVVGFHEGGFTPFEFRVDEMTKVGEENVLTLRVVGPLFLSDKEIDGMKALEMPQWRGGITGGIWQSVSLVATNEVYVKDVFIEPKLSDNTANFHIELDHTGIKDIDGEIEVNIFNAQDRTKVVASHSENLGIHSGQNKHSWSIVIPETKYWSPDNPHLYYAEVNIKKDGVISDSWSTRFGMRELTIKDRDFHLNGERIYIKASFFEGLYPNSIAYPESEEMARKEIRLAKEAGFNMIRPWRRPPAPMWLDLADEMGVLVVGSPALECMQLPFSTPYLPMRVENELRQAILRDRNRASVVQWELFNELHRPVLKQMMRPMATLTRALDPTRLILDESGGWAFGANMYLPYQYEPTKFNDIHNYPGPFINKNRYDGYLSIGLTKEEKKAMNYVGATPGRNVVPGLMSYVSELGYGSLPNLTTNNAQFQKEGNALTPAYRYHERLAKEQEHLLKESGFANLYPDMEQFYLDQQHIHGSANKRMIEAIRLNPEIDGYCIHALVAGDWILGAGLLDLWRNPKTYAYEATKAANQPQIISIRAIPRNIYAEQGTKIEVHGMNELGEANGKLKLMIENEDGKIVFDKSVDLGWQQGISELLTQNINTENWSGNYNIICKIIDKNEAILTENHYTIDVFRQDNLNTSKTKIAVIDAKGVLTTFLKRKGLEVTTFQKSTRRSTPVLVTGTKDEASMDKIQMIELQSFIQKGGTVVYLEGAEKDIVDESEVFPMTGKAHPAVGLWTCMPHLVHKHPIFEGLPSNGPMRDIYENVWANRTLRDLKGKEDLSLKPIVGVVAFDWFSKEHKMHYSGPGTSWWGVDLGEMSIGKGKVIISQLRLMENLGTDPVADKILLNIIRYLRKK